MEKRKEPRILISMEVTYENRNEFSSSYLFDVSGGGVFIRTADPLEAGSRVQVCFHLPDMTDAILADGTVVWSVRASGSERPGMGIRFDRLGPTDRQRLSQFIDKHSR